MLLMGEAFVEYLWKHDVFQEKDIIGKNCLVVGGSYISGGNYAPLLNKRLLHLGAARCDNVMLFDPYFQDSFCDLTDTAEAIGALRYDLIIVLSGMEKTRNIREGVRQLQEVCHVGGKIFVTARTPHDISARRELHTYEDIWRYDLESLEALFHNCIPEKTAVDEGNGLVAVMFVRGESIDTVSSVTLFNTKRGEHVTIDDALPRGYFDDLPMLDAIGLKYRTDKCSMEHNYLNKYAFFLEKFRLQPIRLLELGIFNGASLRMWQEYFPYAEIYGVDIADRCSQYADERIHIIQVDLSDPERVAKLKEIRPQIIIDAVGATNVFADMKSSSWENVSWERVVQADPDVIVLAEASWSTVESKKNRLESDPVLSQLKAVKNKAYITISFAESTPGMRLVDGAKTVSDQIAKL